MMSGACWAGPTDFAPVASAGRGAAALVEAGRGSRPFGPAGAGAVAVGAAAGSAPAAAGGGGGMGVEARATSEGAAGAMARLSPLAHAVWAASRARANATSGA